MLTLCTTASSLWDLMAGTHISRPSWPAGLTDEQEDLIAEFLDNLNDWRDVDSMNNANRIRCEAIKDLQGYMTQLQEMGLLIGAGVRRCLLTGGSQAPEPWRIIDIEIRPLGIAQLVDKDGNKVWPATAELLVMGRRRAAERFRPLTWLPRHFAREPGTARYGDKLAHASLGIRIALKQAGQLAGPHFAR